MPHRSSGIPIEPNFSVDVFIDVARALALEDLKSEAVRNTNAEGEHMVHDGTVVCMSSELCSSFCALKLRKGCSGLTLPSNFDDSSANSESANWPAHIVTRSVGRSIVNDDVRSSNAIPETIPVVLIAMAPVEGQYEDAVASRCR